MAKNKKRKLSTTPKPSSSTAADVTEPSADVTETSADVTEPTPVADVEITESVPETTETTETVTAADAEIEEDEADDEEDPNPAPAADQSDSADEANDPESIQKLLEPFTKDQLLLLLRDAAVNHPDVFKSIQSIADADSAHRKIFVHGLGWDTNSDTLRSAFDQFGEIEDCKAVIDKATGKSKGYGFILFKHRSGAQRALKEPQKKIGNRMTACQLASAGPVPAATQQPQAVAVAPESEHTMKKIFVSNVGADVDPQKLLRFFAEFGEIEEGPLGLDKATGKPKGFALFVYKSVESARKALAEPHKSFEGHILHCQKAIDGPKANKVGFQFQASSSGAYQGGQFPKNDRMRNPMGGAGGHLMAPPATGMGFNQAAQFPAGGGAGMNPALGQALNALFATQGAGGLGFLGNMGSGVAGGPVANPGVAGQLGSSGSYGNQVAGVGANIGNGMMGGYGAMQGGYANAPAGRGAGRSQYGLGQMGGMKSYRGQ